MTNGPHALWAEAVGSHSNEAVARGDLFVPLIVGGVVPGVVLAYVVPEIVVAPLHAGAGVGPGGDDGLARHGAHRFRLLRTILTMCSIHGSKITSTVEATDRANKLGDDGLLEGAARELQTLLAELASAQNCAWSISPG